MPPVILVAASLMTNTLGGGGNVAPVANFSRALVVNRTWSVTNLSTDSDGTIVSWDWDWGDGTAHGTTATPGNHTYATDGAKTITLTVTDNGGATHAAALGLTVAGWDVDATADRAIPANAAQMSNMIAAAGVTATCIALYTMQEASGSVLDKVGSRNLTATNVTYANTISGWSSKAIANIYGGTSKLVNTTFPDVSANPITIMSWVGMGAIGAQMTVKRIGSGFNVDASIEIDASPKLLAGSYDSRAGGPALSLPKAPFPLVLAVDSVFAKEVRVYTGTELTHVDDNDVPIGTELWYGGDNTQTYFASSASWMWSAVLSKALGADEARAIIATAGWSVPTAYPQSIIKVGGTTAYDGEASSPLLGTGTVAVQFTIGGILAAPAYIVGFSPTAAGFASGAYAGLNIDGGTIYWVETGGAFGSLGAIAKGDLWEVKRVTSTGAIEYRKNTVLVRTSPTVTFPGSILVDTSHRFAGYGPKKLRVLDASSNILAISWATTNVKVY